MNYDLLGEIISQAILDGQNQIHDLYQKKATDLEVSERMRKSFEFHYLRAKKLINK